METLFRFLFLVAIFAIFIGAIVACYECLYSIIFSEMEEADEEAKCENKNIHSEH